MKKHFLELLAVFIANSLIATILWLSGMHGNFAKIWVVSQCIGFGILFTQALLCLVSGRDRPSWISWPASIMLGGAIGIGLAILLGVLPGIEENPPQLLRIGLLAIVFGILMSFFFYQAARFNALKLAQREAELREMARQKEAAIAHLKLLQAQIEPHFLFNTLANLHSLIGQNDNLAKTLLERLNDYLRASLSHSRADTATLADESRMLAAFLDIHSVRTGGRIKSQIDISEALRSLPFPPMLLQPLVENAISHGLEPKLGQGQVEIIARIENQFLSLKVRDDGIGLQSQKSGHGVGLANVRERLASLYGPSAELRIRDNQLGVIAELWIPLAPVP